MGYAFETNACLLKTENPQLLPAFLIITEQWEMDGRGERRGGEGKEGKFITQSF